MKKQSIFLWILWILLPFLSMAQEENETPDHFKKGKNILGAQLTMGWSGLSGLTGRETLRYGHFFADKLAMGVELRHAFSGSFKSGEIAPFIRYYLSEKKLAPFVEAQYAWMMGDIRSFDGSHLATTQAHRGFVGAGLAYTPFRRIGIEMYTGYEVSNQYNETETAFSLSRRSTYGRLSTGIRLNFHF